MVRFKFLRVVKLQRLVRVRFRQYFYFLTLLIGQPLSTGDILSISGASVLATCIIWRLYGPHWEPVPCQLLLASWRAVHLEYIHTFPLIVQAMRPIKLVSLLFDLDWFKRVIGHLRTLEPFCPFQHSGLLLIALLLRFVEDWLQLLNFNRSLVVDLEDRLHESIVTYWCVELVT